MSKNKGLRSVITKEYLQREYLEKGRTASDIGKNMINFMLNYVGNLGLFERYKMKRYAELTGNELLEVEDKKPLR